MSDEFPYAEDGVIEGDFTEQFRFPVIDCPYPRWNYITAVLGDTDQWNSARPTEDELRIVASFHQAYIEHWYYESYKAKMRARPFDIDGGANSRILVKYQHGGWGYRRRTWDYGTSPGFRDDPHTLDHVLDMEAGHDSERWAAWKAAHPEVFGVES